MVELMAVRHPAELDDEALLKQCRFDRGRTSGPGGQHRNKVETWVKLTHLPSGTSAQAGERRSQAQNKKVALRRLRLELALGIRSEPGPGPSDLWRSRCRKGKVRCNPAHADFAAILAEALDAIGAAGQDPRPAAESLGCTASQLVKLVAQHPPAFSAWNAERERLGLRRLH